MHTIVACSKPVLGGKANVWLKNDSTCQSWESHTSDQDVKNAF